MIKKVILGVVAVILVGVIGRATWAFFEVRKVIAEEAALSAEALRIAEEEARAAAILASIPKAPEGCPNTKLPDEVWVTGSVVFPKGIKASAGYSVMSNAVTYPIDVDGSFCAISVAGQTAQISAVSTSTTNGFILSAIFNSNTDTNDFLINATSTAITLVYNSPLIGPNASPNILDAIATSTAVTKLATSISAATTLSSSDLKTGGKLLTAYNTAVKSVQPKTIVPAKTTPVVKSVTQTTKPPATTVVTPKPVTNTPAATTTPAPTTPATTTPAVTTTTTTGTEPVIIDATEAVGI